MIGTRTPFRISFIGGGTDFKEFYTQNPGCVISCAINKYMYIFLHKYFDDRIQIKYSQTELVNNINEINHPIVRTILNKFKISGIDINSIADIPAGTGLGSSSSYTVGLLLALYAYKNEKYTISTIAKEACKIEIDDLKEPIGKQDQYAAAYGGINFIKFQPNGDVEIEPILTDPVNRINFRKNLLLFYTGIKRKAYTILKDQQRNITEDKNKLDTLVKLTEITKESKLKIETLDFDGFAKMMGESWELKKSLANKISNTYIDDIYSLAIKNGAIGGKLLGAGGGGFFLFYCHEEKQDTLKSALRHLKLIDFDFDNEGAKLYINDQQNNIRT